MTHFLIKLICSTFVILLAGCASTPKYHGRFSGYLESTTLRDVSGGEFAAVKLKISSAEFTTAKPESNIIGIAEILVDDSWNCYRPADFKTNQVTVVGWMQTGSIKNPSSHKEISALQDRSQYLQGALVVKRRNIYYSHTDK